MQVKNKVRQRCLFSIVVLLISFLLPLPILAANTATNTPVATKIAAKGAIVVDAKSGQVLGGQNMTKLLPAASTSKLLTVYLVHQAIAAGKLTWQTPVKISKNIAKVSVEPELTNVTLTANKSYRVIDLYRAALLDSANAAAMALGQAVSGSQKAFVAKMQQQLKHWGITDAKIYGAAGLKNSQVYTDAVGTNRNAENMMSVQDMAIIASHLVNTYPSVLKTTKLTTAKFNTTTTLTSTNWLLPGGQVSTKYHFDGLKTGASLKALGNFVGTLTYKQRRLITVVYGAGTANAATDPARFIQTNNLLNTVLKQKHYIKLAAHRKNVKIKVKNGQKQVITSTNKQAIGAWVNHNVNKLEVKAVKTDNNQAPLKKGAKVGKLQVAGVYLPTYQKINADLVTKNKVSRANFLILAWRNITSWF